MTYTLQLTPIDRLALRRVALRLSVQDLARSIGLAPRRLREIEAGRQKPSEAEVTALDRALAV